MKRVFGILVVAILSFGVGFFISYLLTGGKFGSIERLFRKEEFIIENKTEKEKRKVEREFPEVYPVGREKGKEKKLAERKEIEKPVAPSVKEVPIEVGKGYRYVSIIIDDMGDSVEKARIFASLPIDITLSIIPYLPHYRECMEVAKVNGRSFMIHIPMEANSRSNEIVNIEKKTKNLLRVSMSDSEIERLVLDMVNSMPGAVSANNHMGSLFTENRDKMRVVLEVLKERGLFFVDSLTTTNSAACSAGSDVGMIVVKRNVFLDNKRDVEEIKKSIRLLINTAKKRGYAVAIGHPYDVTYQAIREMIPQMEREGIRVVSIDKLKDIVTGGRNEGCF